MTNEELLTELGRVIEAVKTDHPAHDYLPPVELMKDVNGRYLLLDALAARAMLAAAIAL